MNDFYQRLVAAIIRQEGMPAFYPNPGNLRGAPWLTHPPTVNGFWVPGSRAIGIAGLVHLVALHVAQGNTLRDFIAGHPGIYSGFAPGSDQNKPDIYIANVKQWASILDESVPMWTLIGA